MILQMQDLYLQYASCSYDWDHYLITSFFNIVKYWTTDVAPGGNHFFFSNGVLVCC